MISNINIPLQGLLNIYVIRHEKNLEIPVIGKTRYIEIKHE